MLPFVHKIFSKSYNKDTEGETTQINTKPFPDLGGGCAIFVPAQNKVTLRKDDTVLVCFSHDKAVYKFINSSLH